MFISFSCLPLLLLSKVTVIISLLIQIFCFSSFTLQNVHYIFQWCNKLCSCPFICCTPDTYRSGKCFFLLSYTFSHSWKTKRKKEWFSLSLFVFFFTPTFWWLRMSMRRKFFSMAWWKKSKNQSKCWYICWLFVTCKWIWKFSDYFHSAYLNFFPLLLLSPQSLTTCIAIAPNHLLDLCWIVAMA